MCPPLSVPRTWHKLQPPLPARPLEIGLPASVVYWSQICVDPPLNNGVCESIGSDNRAFPTSAPYPMPHIPTQMISDWLTAMTWPLLVVTKASNMPTNSLMTSVMAAKTWGQILNVKQCDKVSDYQNTFPLVSSFPKELSLEFILTGEKAHF